MERSEVWVFSVQSLNKDCTLSVRKLAAVSTSKEDAKSQIKERYTDAIIIEFVQKFTLV